METSNPPPPHATVASIYAAFVALLTQSRLDMAKAVKADKAKHDRERALAGNAHHLSQLGTKSRMEK